MKFIPLPLTGTNDCINFTNAACPRLAQGLFKPDHIRGLTTSNLSTDLNSKLKLKLKLKSISALLNQPKRFKRISVILSPKWHPAHIHKLNHNQPQPKIQNLSSGHFYGLINSALKKGLLLCAHALRTWFMQNQNSDLQITTIRWVTVEKCAELVGWSKDAINALRVKGKIRVNIHWIKRNGRIFIDMAAFQQWIKTGV
jgi:hypothetical protein